MENEWQTDGMWMEPGRDRKCKDTHIGWAGGCRNGFPVPRACCALQRENMALFGPWPQKLQVLNSADGQIPGRPPLLQDLVHQHKGGWKNENDASPPQNTQKPIGRQLVPSSPAAGSLCEPKYLKTVVVGYFETSGCSLRVQLLSQPR